jgi:peptide/nickel transport system permease protein
VEGRAAGEVTADAMKIAKAIEFPNGYGLTLGGASRELAEIFSELLTALVLCIGVMYLVLVMQFGSFTAPLPVMLSLPLSLIGVVLALLVTGGTLNLMSLIGVIMLMGLVAKNAILLLDCALQGEWDAFRDAASHLVLPSAVLGLFSTAYISRMTRSFMINELQQHYVITARVKGLSERRVVWGHALRNAVVPLLTVIALSYANLLEGSVLTETVFAWPGLGRYITNSLLNADMSAVLGGTIVVGLVFVGINLLSDVLARIFDPRAR